MWPLLYLVVPSICLSILGLVAMVIILGNCYGIQRFQRVDSLAVVIIMFYYIYRLLALWFWLNFLVILMFSLDGHTFYTLLWINSVSVLPLLICMLVGCGNIMNINLDDD